MQQKRGADKVLPLQGNDSHAANWFMWPARAPLVPAAEVKGHPPFFYERTPSNRAVMKG